MKKVFLFLAMSTGSFAAFGQTSDQEITMVRVVSRDNSGVNAIDVVSGALVRMPKEIQAKVGEVIPSLPEVWFDTYEARD